MGIVTKAELRRKKLLSRRDIGSRQKNILDRAICSNLIASHEYISTSIILCYVSMSEEIDTLEILRIALSDKKRVFVPRCGKEYSLVFHEIESLSQLAVGAYSILEPSEVCPIIDNTANSICIVPALCFDMMGHRVGYGKGYYDRFLKDFKGVSVGLCYTDNLEDSIPFDNYDVNVDMVLTERGFVK